VKDDSEQLRGGVAGAHGSPLEIQRRVLELIATGQSLDRVLNALVLGMEAQHANMRGSILLIAEDGFHLKTAAAPNLPARYQELVEELIGIGPTAGSCGTACFRRARVVVKDIATDPLWSAYTEIAEQFELRACWSEPIFSRDGSVLGSFAMYYAEPRAPSTQELESINIAARLAAIAIDRARADAALRLNEERLNFALTASKMGTWDWDIERDYVAWSDGVELGLTAACDGSSARVACIGGRTARPRAWPARSRTSRSANARSLRCARAKSSSASHRRWKPSVAWRAAWHMISTIC
jgi:hypothetical protein